MEILKSLFRTLASYIGLDEENKTQNEQPGGQRDAESLDGVKKQEQNLQEKA